jgi:GMP synthase (glutamine-hydrolysing)
MKPLLIIQTGRAPEPIRGRHGDFPHWFRIGTQLPTRWLQTVNVSAGESLPAAHAGAGAIITGSAAMVTERAAWSERTADWIRDAMNAEIPLFGVCYGHQLMAHAMGGRVDYLAGGREIGTQPIELLAQGQRDPTAEAGLRPGPIRARPASDAALRTQGDQHAVPPRVQRRSYARLHQT